MSSEDNNVDQQLVFELWTASDHRVFRQTANAKTVFGTGLWESADLKTGALPESGQYMFYVSGYGDDVASYNLVLQRE
jgi:hypothetical protein